MAIKEKSKAKLTPLVHCEIDLAALASYAEFGGAAGSGQKGDWLTGGLGQDTVLGGAGNDELSVTRRARTAASAARIAPRHMARTGYFGKAAATIGWQAMLREALLRKAA